MRPGLGSKAVRRQLQWLFVGVTLVGCHGAFTADPKPETPTAMCLDCCTQERDACKIDAGHYPGALCPGRDQLCRQACGEGDENEMCVVMANREFAARAPKAKTAAAPALARATAATPARVRLGECDNRGTWTLTIADGKGEARGCTALDSVPKEVSFRIGRRHDAYVLYDLSPVPGWSDAFTVENRDDACIVILERQNLTEAEKPRSLAVKLEARDRAVSGTLTYAEANQPAGCALDAPVAGSVVAPPPQASPPPPPPPPPPTPSPSPIHPTMPMRRY